MDINSPMTPTTMRMRPTVWTLNPGVLTVTAKSRIAPKAMRKIHVPRPMRPSLWGTLWKRLLLPICPDKSWANHTGGWLPAPGVFAEIDDAFADRDCDGLQFRVRPELGEDRLDVFADRIDGQEELVGHRRVLGPPRQQREDLPLPVGERRADTAVVPAQLRQEPCQHGRGDQGLPGVGGPDRGDRLADRTVLCDVPRAPGLDRGDKDRVVREARQHHDPDDGVLLTDEAGGIGAQSVGQPVVHEHHIR